MNVLLRSASALALVAASLAAPAQSILTNLGGSYTPIVNTAISTTLLKAVGLTTGATPLSIVSIGTLMSKQSLNTPASFTAGIYADLNSAPGAQLAGFSSATVTSMTASVFTLTPLSPFVLAPNTAYWFVLTSSVTDGDLNWNGLNPSTTPTPTGVSYVGYRRTMDSGATWMTSTVFNGVDIRANPTPEPSALAALGLGAVAVLRRRRRA